MRVISYTTKFKKDLDRERRGGKHKKQLQMRLTELLELLAADTPLPSRFRDHPLSGQWQDFRDCHVLPDLILIYQKPDAKKLVLARIGSHSELSL